MSLSPGLYVWLGFLVVTCLASVFFVYEHTPARWVLAGFVVSHIIVFILSATKHITLRIGMVSLNHLVCWTPGLISTITDVQGRDASVPYAVWSYLLIFAVSVSFLFDLRDAGTYLYYLITGKFPLRGNP